MKKDYVRPLDLRHGRTDMNHGAGGRASAQLVDELFARAFDNPGLSRGGDGAVLAPPPESPSAPNTGENVMSDIAETIAANLVDKCACRMAPPLGIRVS